jgi:hypothetical protein
MSAPYWQRLFAFVSRIGCSPNEDDDRRIRRMIFVGASLAGVFSLPIYVVLFSAFGAPLASMVMFAYLTICLLNLAAFGMVRAYFEIFLFILLTTHMIASLLVTLVLGGLIPSAMHAVWGLLSPLGAIVVYRPKTGSADSPAMWRSSPQAYTRRTTSAAPPILSTLRRYRR